MDAQGKELQAADIWTIFADTYRLGEGAPAIAHQRIEESADGAVRVAVQLDAGGEVIPLNGEGRGPVEAFVDGLQRATGCRIEVLDYHEHAIGSGAQARAAAYLEMRIGDTRTLFGVGIDANIVTASMKAVLSGLLRCAIPLAAAVVAIPG